MVIQPNYDAALSFTEDLAAVSIDGRWGFINADGDIIIDIKHDNVTPYDNGLSLVNLNETLSYIDKKGKEIWSAQATQLA